MRMSFVKEVGFWGLCAIFLAFTPLALSQTIKIYPGSFLSFQSGKQFTGAKQGCPQGGGSDGFKRVIWANGWPDEDREISLRDWVDGSNTFSVRETSLITVHADSKRLRHWLVKETRNLYRDSNNIYMATCTTIAILQGDRLDDYLEIDIGVLIGRKPEKGEFVNPITVSPPAYCLKPWYTQRKDSLDQITSQFDCKTIGIENLAQIYQKENLAR